MREDAVPIQVHCIFDMMGMGWNVMRILREEKKSSPSNVRCVRAH